MIVPQNWFEIEQTLPYLYTIRERLDKLDTRFLTKYTNLYLIIGAKSALLFDTGSGIGNLSRVVDEIIEDRDLIVVNSHNHFDHVGSNHQFEETHIQRWDFRKLMYPFDVSFLQSSESPFVEVFMKKDWKMDFAEECVPLIGNEVFELGGITLELLYTPGHTPGSICMFSDKGDVFTGDTIHYGAVFLPGLDKIPYYNQSLKELDKRVQQIDDVRIFPGHEDFNVGIDLFDRFMNEYNELATIKGEYDPFLEATIHISENFTFVKPTEKSANYQTKEVTL